MFHYHRKLSYSTYCLKEKCQRPTYTHTAFLKFLLKYSEILSISVRPCRNIDVDDAIDDDDDDDDMVAPDDVEEDLAEILKDRLAAEDLPEDEDEVVEVDDRTGSDDALQPRRADEVLCNSCFMLVRQNAPTCPMGDDACPIVVKKK